MKCYFTGIYVRGMVHEQKSKVQLEINRLADLTNVSHTQSENDQVENVCKELLW